MSPPNRPPLLHPPSGAPPKVIHQGGQMGPMKILVLLGATWIRQFILLPEYPVSARNEAWRDHSRHSSDVSS